MTEDYSWGMEDMEIMNGESYEPVKVTTNTLILNVDMGVGYTGDYDDPKNADWIAEQHREIVKKIALIDGVENVEIEDVER